MPRIVALLAVLALAGPATLGFAAAQSAPPPTCFGREATIADHAGEIVGTPGDDVIVGNDARNVVYGGGGTDRICTGAGDDTVETQCCPQTVDLFVDSGDGNDVIDGYASGRNEINSGAGDDFVTTAGGSGTILAGAGNDVVYGGSGVEEIHGGDGNDSLYGYGDADSLFGDAGADGLYGGQGFDALDGGTSTRVVRSFHRHRNGRGHLHESLLAHSDLCQVGSGGGTVANCERET